MNMNPIARRPAKRPLTRRPVARRCQRHRKKQLARMGAAAVEFAVVANILFIMILACIELARMNMVRNLAQDAAYFAARNAIVPGATSAEANAVADQVMSTLLTSGYTVDVGALDEDSDEITVTVTVDYSQVALFTPYFLTDAEIETTATMRTERYDHFYEQ